MERNGKSRWVVPLETRRKGKKEKPISGVQELFSENGFTLHKWRPRVTWIGSDGRRRLEPQPECDSLKEAQDIRDKQKAKIKQALKEEGKQEGRAKLDAQRVTFGQL